MAGSALFGIGRARVHGKQDRWSDARLRFYSYQVPVGYYVE